MDDMSLFTFECPVCEGMFRADESAMEVTCPHCHQAIRLVDDSSAVSEGNVDIGQSQVEMSVTRIKPTAPLLPPRFARQENPENTDEASVAPPVITAAKDQAVTPHAVSEEAKLPALQGDGGEGAEGDDVVNIESPIEGELPVDLTIETLISIEQVESRLERETERETQQETERDTEQETEQEIAAALADLESAFEEELSGSGFLPQTLDGESGEPGEKVALPTSAIEIVETEKPKAMESVSIKMRDKPLTVGHGADKIELLSRTPEEKSQFRRNKNVIIWSIGALLILLTMLVMLNFT